MNRWPPCPQDPVSEVSGTDLWPCWGACPKQPWPWLPGSAPTISWLPGVWWISSPAILPRGSREPLHTGSHGTPEGLSPRCPRVTCLIHTFMGCLPPCLTFPLSSNVSRHHLPNQLPALNPGLKLCFWGTQTKMSICSSGARILQTFTPTAFSTAYGAPT